MQSTILPPELRRPDRFDQIAERHRKALCWEPQGWIPLGIIVNDPAHTAGLSYDQWLEPRPFFEAQARILRDTLTVGSDHMPVMPLNHVGDVLIPTLFGAELFVPSTMAASLQDTGATPRPVFGDIREVDGLGVPAFTEGCMPAFEAIIRAWRGWLPPWVQIVTPAPIGPFSLAAELRGTGFFMDIMEDPERSHRLLDLCARVQVATERHLRSITANSSPLWLSGFGVRTLGRRIGDDTIINLSTDHIRAFAVPYIEAIARALGPATLHFCTLPHRRADHVFDALAGADGISTASTQFGFEYYAEHVADLRGRLSIESLYGDAFGYLVERCGSFRDWAFDFVGRFKDVSGLVLYCQVPDVETGRELWEVWRAAHG